MNTFTDIQHISDHFLLKGGFCQDVSLFNGKMGISIFFFLLSRQTGNRWYEEFAGELLDDVCLNLSTSLPATFADGLCGIGWGIEFLKQNCFVEGDTDKILNEVDMRVMERDPRQIFDTSFETGLKGIATYVKSRIDSKRNGLNVPFESTYLEELQNACKKSGIVFFSDKFTVDSVWKQILKSFEDNLFIETDAWRWGLLLINKMCHE